MPEENRHGQSKQKNTRFNIPFDRVDEEICRDLVGPFTKRDRRENCYLAVFVDHFQITSEWLLFKSKMEWQKDLFGSFKIEFSHMIHVLRTDSDG